MFGAIGGPWIAALGLVFVVSLRVVQHVTYESGYRKLYEQQSQMFNMLQAGVSSVVEASQELLKFHGSEGPELDPLFHDLSEVVRESQELLESRGTRTTRTRLPVFFDLSDEIRALSDVIGDEFARM